MEMLYSNLSTKHHYFNKENRMNYRILFLINAFIAVLFGLGFLVVPGMVLNQFGVDEYASTRLVSQFFGTAMLALGLLLWFVKDVMDLKLQKGMEVALLVGAAAGLIITVAGTASGILRTNWWLAVVIYVLFGLSYAYLVFLKPRSEAR
jgi:uncharacterized membrane protein YfcA